MQPSKANTTCGGAFLRWFLVLLLLRASAGGPDEHPLAARGDSEQLRFVVQFDSYYPQQQHLDLLGRAFGAEVQCAATGSASSSSSSYCWHWLPRSNSAVRRWPSSFALVQVSSNPLGHNNTVLTDSEQLTWLRSLVTAASHGVSHRVKSITVDKVFRAQPATCPTVPASNAHMSGRCALANDTHLVEKSILHAATLTPHSIGHLLQAHEPPPWVELQPLAIRAALGLDPPGTPRLLGTGVTVAILDTGLAQHHPWFDSSTAADSEDGVLRGGLASGRAPDSSPPTPAGCSSRSRVCERNNWTGEKTAEDRLGHGTFVAGIVAGQSPQPVSSSDSEADCSGVAPGASILSFRVFDSAQRSRSSWLLDATAHILGLHTGGAMAAVLADGEAVVRDADDPSADPSSCPCDTLRDTGALHIDVVNLSIGGPDFTDEPFNDAINALCAAGILLVTASGNSGPLSGTLTSPADLPCTLAVGGSQWPTGEAAPFSSNGPTLWRDEFAGRHKPEVAAYATKLCGPSIPAATASTRRAGGAGDSWWNSLGRRRQSHDEVASVHCRSVSGTSVASPVVASAAALVAEAASLRPYERAIASANAAFYKQALLSYSAAAGVADAVRPMLLSAAALASAVEYASVTAPREGRVTALPPTLSLHLQQRNAMPSGIHAIGNRSSLADVKVVMACNGGAPIQPLWLGGPALACNVSILNSIGSLSWLAAAQADSNALRSSSHMLLGIPSAGGVLQVRLVAPERWWPHGGWLSVWFQLIPAVPSAAPHSTWTCPKTAQWDDDCNVVRIDSNVKLKIHTIPDAAQGGTRHGGASAPTTLRRGGAGVRPLTSGEPLASPDNRWLHADGSFVIESTLDLPVSVSVALRPPPMSQRLLVDTQLHSAVYPLHWAAGDEFGSGYHVPRSDMSDNSAVLPSTPAHSAVDGDVGEASDPAPLDGPAGGDALAGNFASLAAFLRLQHFAVITAHPSTSVQQQLCGRTWPLSSCEQQVGAVIVVDPELPWSTEGGNTSELAALTDAMSGGTSLIVFADWYHPDVLSALFQFDESGRKWQHMAVGGSNLSAINAMLAHISADVTDTSTGKRSALLQFREDAVVTGVIHAGDGIHAARFGSGAVIASICGNTTAFPGAQLTPAVVDERPADVSGCRGWQVYGLPAQLRDETFAVLASVQGGTPAGRSSGASYGSSRRSTMYPAALVRPPVNSPMGRLVVYGDSGCIDDASLVRHAGLYQTAAGATEDNVHSDMLRENLRPGFCAWFVHGMLDFVRTGDVPLWPALQQLQ